LERRAGWQASISLDPCHKKDKHSALNGANFVLCGILKIVVASATEAELGALFLNCKEGKTLRLTLEEIGHNMDDSSPVLWKKIIRKMQCMKQSLTSTVFLFCSPQFMIKDATFLQIIIQCAQTGMLRNIVADKAQIFVIHGQI